MKVTITLEEDGISKSRSYETITLEEDDISKSRMCEAYRITSILHIPETDKYRIHYDKYPLGEHYFHATKYGIDHSQIEVGDHLLLNPEDGKILILSPETFGAVILGDMEMVDGEIMGPAYARRSNK